RPPTSAPRSPWRERTARADRGCAPSPPDRLHAPPAQTTRATRALPRRAHGAAPRAHRRRSSPTTADSRDRRDRRRGARASACAGSFPLQSSADTLRRRGHYRGGAMTRHRCFALAFLITFSIGAVPAVAAAEVPTPESFLGFKPGTDGKLASWPQVLQYLRLVDAASDRVTVEIAGRSTLG